MHAGGSKSAMRGVQFRAAHQKIIAEYYLPVGKFCENNSRYRESEKFTSLYFPREIRAGTELCTHASLRGGERSLELIKNVAPYIWGSLKGKLLHIIPKYIARLFYIYSKNISKPPCGEIQNVIPVFYDLKYYA